ncbi:hypothetical protein ILUMI_01316 [Ignelater luminosus]|uniref:Arrestin C-terminal-like domain-containing protein n=1 Tax=Ignelater luminosus TaxID=2038154 RepID=A0A8K0GHJ6_IGNLU|nr:hypothetical protein ILUMI_01316 [Ignelater luminosus]
MSFIRIHLDNYNGYCYPGQIITGRVVCNFNKEKKLRAIRIKFKGKAKTKWTESESSYNSTTESSESTTVIYHAEEEYLNTEYTLVHGKNENRLPPGNHIYSFSYNLPAHLPSSFEGRYGNIRYYIKVVMDRPWKLDYKHLFNLNVVSPVNLNYVRGVSDPVATSIDKTMCSCWCNDSGALTFDMSLPAAGFVPGQKVNIGARIKNTTNVRAEYVEFKIISKLEFITHSPSKNRRSDEKVLIVVRTARGIGAHTDKSWTSTFTIPGDIPYPNLIPCSIINLTYHLKAKVVLPWPHTNIKIEVPLVIGTVPLTGMGVFRRRVERGRAKS